MSFQIPVHDGDSLNVYSRAGLEDLRRIAYTEYEPLRASIETITASGGSYDTSELDRAEALAAFIAAVDTRLDALDADAARARSLPAAPAARPATEPVTAAVETEDDCEDDEKKAAVTASTRVTVTEIAPSVIETATPKRTVEKRFTITAAAETGVAAGAILEDFGAVTAAFLERTSTYGSSVGRRGTEDALHHRVAKINRIFDGNRMYRPGMDEPAIYQMGRDATDEKLLPGGSLLDAVVAGVGWCGPSTTIYTTCSPITGAGMWQGPEIGAPRGGIKHNQGIEFSTIFGGGTGYNILTEAQVIADVTKTCVQIPCLSFVDDRLKAQALCLTGDLLQNVGYPEFVQTFIEGAINAQAHNVNRDIIATIVAGSMAVDISTVDPWVSDNSVVSQVMSAAEMAVWDIRYKLRLDPNATIEMVFPYWVLPQMRADWIRRNGVMNPDLLDSMIMSMFATRGVAPQFVYDWQDAFSGLTTTGPGAATPLKALPASPTVNLQFLAYPAGTWLLAREPVIRLDSVYDSTLLSTNKVTQLFMEDGYLPMRMCPVSRVYTVNICPNGSTGAQRAVTCTDVTP